MSKNFISDHHSSSLQGKKPFGFSTTEDQIFGVQTVVYHTLGLEVSLVAWTDSSVEISLPQQEQLLLGSHFYSPIQLNMSHPREVELHVNQGRREQWIRLLFLSHLKNTGS